METSLYTFVGFRPDGRSVAVDVIQASSPEAAMAQARRFLAEHASCQSVEIYSAGELVAAVSAIGP